MGQYPNRSSVSLTNRTGCRNYGVANPKSLESGLNQSRCMPIGVCLPQKTTMLEVNALLLMHVVYKVCALIMLTMD